MSLHGPVVMGSNARYQTRFHRDQREAGIAGLAWEGRLDAPAAGWGIEIARLIGIVALCSAMLFVGWTLS